MIDRSRPMSSQVYTQFRDRIFRESVLSHRRRSYQETTRFRPFMLIVRLKLAEILTQSRSAVSLRHCSTLSASGSRTWQVAVAENSPRIHVFGNDGPVYQRLHHPKHQPSSHSHRCSILAGYGKSNMSLPGWGLSRSSVVSDNKTNITFFRRAN